mmetsp:Transcript_45711/g.74561  ORF Transcript_45711/g.74561 Transcript_45711/m.74561 type:complete len:620 (+) Transcript_45711:19-1878(+)|eukprot:CAMPEP_0184362442 /NCGR_PEP_ID=MMETSP1089-20130417/134887_1 /TAXON_ID=38269 ORGANISM="Gloeochaete wittrockiana, Strain SAG46.84" /NCGR_SAMPLE_ID=MMETSP1089 /ASSEMBLY_ACC=CAM_ASM_000445 /LENGTH=619 /DNA_ID=CAMNT_0026702511 /DNA_START=20 /DNA_END=1879 /DNA_ORIENTATION=+
MDDEYDAPGGEDAADENQNENEEDDDNQELKPSARNYVIILIDFSKSMFEKQAGEDVVPIVQALHATHMMIKDRIISNPQDSIGIVFYNTHKTESTIEVTGVCPFQELDLPDRERIKSLVGAYENLEALEAEYGHSSSPVDFAQVLWKCTSVFNDSTLASKAGVSKEIWVMTNNDTPCSSRDEKNKLIQRAKDSHGLGITLKGFFVSSAQHAFNYHHQWQTVLEHHNGEEPGALYTYEISESWSEFESKARRKIFKKRTFMRLPWVLGDGVQIIVSMYVLVNETKRPAHKYVDARASSEVFSKRQMMCADLGDCLQPSDIGFSFDIGGEGEKARVEFTREEVAQIKNFGDVSLKLMGFKPRSRLKWYHNLKHSYFIYPDEEGQEGATLAFHALYDRMIHHDKIAICRYVTRAIHSARFVALLPQKELLDEHGQALYPQGFHVISLPYSDDIRAPKLPPPCDVAQEQINTAKTFIKKFGLKRFSCTNFENYSLQKFYSTLEAVALDTAIVEPDDTLVPPKSFEKADYVQAVKDFRDVVFGDDYDDYVLKKSQPAAKKAKKAPEAAADGSYDWQGLVQSGEIQKVTIATLHNYLVQHGLKKSGKKGELVERVVEHVKQNMI